MEWEWSCHTSDFLPERYDHVDKKSTTNSRKSREVFPPQTLLTKPSQSYRTPSPFTQCRCPWPQLSPYLQECRLLPDQARAALASILKKRNNNSWQTSTLKVSPTCDQSSACGPTDFTCQSSTGRVNSNPLSRLYLKTSRTTMKARFYASQRLSGISQWRNLVTSTTVTLVNA